MPPAAMRLLNGVVEFLSLRIAWSFDAKQMGDCRSNIDIINVEQSSPSYPRKFSGLSL